jgi:D-alanyl-lipoteichoic acid acyltransferase DltB (MBOAT superfamily)
VLIGARTDTLGAFTSAFAHVGHLVYLIGVGFALGAAQTERGRHLGRVLILGLVSAVFYHAWAAGQHGAYQYLLALIAATIVLDFYLARAIEASERHGVRLALLIVSLVSNLGILAVFKYADFFRLDVLHTGGEPWKLILPAGISFHTFQSLSYTVDVYRREIRATRSVIELATFVLFFPQLVAGPIVRATELLPQLRDLPLFDHDRAADGLFRIVVGLAKKIAIADFLGDALADRVFASTPSCTRRSRSAPASSRTRSRSTWTSRRTPTSRSARRSSWASRCPRTSARRIARRACRTSGGAGTSRCRRGCATTCTSRSAATAAAS